MSSTDGSTALGALGSPVEDDPFLRLTASEIMLSFPMGLAPSRENETPVHGGDPRGVLDALLLRVLEQTAPARVHVLFSGGRDSSAVLAAATSVARRHGLPDPLPVTGRHPGVTEADESQWQELVVRYLGLRDWLRLDLTDEQRWLGPTAVRQLRRHGLVWPASVQLRAAYFPHLPANAVVMTGEGGDHVFLAGRSEGVRRIAAARRPPSPQLVAAVLRSVVPPRTGVGTSWLRPTAARAYRRALRANAREPFRFDRAVLAATTSPADRVIFHNHDAVFAAEGLTVLHPLAHADFRGALAARGGRLGLGDRTAMMRLLFSDVLPDALLRRSTKAAFNLTRWGEAEREFVRRWDGSGVEAAVVDVEALRTAWLAPRPSATSAFLLHHAYLWTEGLPQHGRWRP